MCFGDTIQLLHVKSGKFLTILSDQLARDERQNIRISLSAEGSTFSWLQLLPRYKIDREGDPILSGTEVLIKIAERQNEFIHCADKLPPPGYFHEVNCSLESSSWRLHIYQDVKEAADPTLLLHSQLVFLHDPETRSNVTISSVIDEAADDAGSAAPSCEDTVEVVIQPMGPKGDLDTNALWVVESKAIVIGGPIQWRSDQVRFRNLNTGKYLMMEQTLMEDESGEAKWRSVLTTTSASSSQGTLFSLQELFSTSMYLSYAKAVQIACFGSWLTRGPYNDQMDTFSCFGSRDKHKALSLLILRYVEGSDDVTATTTSVVEDTTGVIEEPRDVNVGVAARNFLKNYLRKTKVTLGERATGSIWSRADAADLPFFQQTMQRIVLFAQGFSISCENTQLAEKPRDFVRTNRQNMICDQGALDILIRILEKLTPISHATEIAKGTNSYSYSSEEERATIKMGTIVVTTCLELLYYTILLNHRNQIFVADSMRILLSHVGSQPLAAKCVTDMLASNMELQEEKISIKEVEIFAEKLSESRLHSMYLDLLRACCSCLGRGVVGNQITVANVLFGQKKELVMLIHANPDKKIILDWGGAKADLFLPVGSSDMDGVMGHQLFTDGAPELLLSWTTPVQDLTSMFLFGKESVPLQDLFKEDVSKSMRAIEAGSTVVEDTRVVSMYFTAQLILAAEMCLGRNYVAMKWIENLLPYETLITMIKMDIDETLRAAAVKLVIRLYVDRDPQVLAVIPALSRSWSLISKHEVPQLPCVDGNRLYHFALLQQIVSKYIESMKGTQWDRVALSMMQMLHKLVEFNFYGDTERLFSVVEPLLLALDRRNVAIAVTTENTMNCTGRVLRSTTARSMSKKMKRMRSQSVIASEMTGPSSMAGVLTLSEGNPLDQSRAAKNSEEDGDKGNHPSWQKIVYDFLTSLPTLVAVIFLVILALTVTLVQTVTGATGQGYRIFDFTVISIFCVEITLRLYCYVYCFKSFLSFFKSVLNCIDVIVVIIDLIILGTPSLAGSGAEFAKVLRIARLARLVRVFRAARLVQKLKSLGTVKYDDWKMPHRFLKTPAHELETMTEAIGVLSHIQHIIEDRNLSLLLHGFYRWEKGLDNRSPAEIFEGVVKSSHELSLAAVSSFEDILIDCLMYFNADLVQGVLNVIVAHNSSRNVLLNNAKEVQLLVSHKREKQQSEIDGMLRQLNRNIETNELWCDLETKEDHRIYEETCNILTRLTEACRSSRKVLEFGNPYIQDVDTQNMLRNHGFFDIAVKALRLLNEYDENDDDGEQPEDINHGIVKMCNQLLYWFVIGNPKNQALAFEHLNFFLDTLDMKIQSHRVIQAIFEGNEELMKLCPRQIIEEFAEKICRCGKRPQYLTLFASITNVGEKNILENQYEIVKQLISPARLPKMVSFCCPIDDPLYEEKVVLMAPYANTVVSSVDELPDELAYHLEFLRVLAGCTVGRINITTVEAKVQSVFDYQDIIDAMLDDRSLLIVNNRLGLFLFDAIIDVEIVIPSLAQSARMWRLLEKFVQVFDDALEDLRLVEKNGWERSRVPRLSIEYTIVAAMIVSGFFNLCYDPAKIKSEEAMVVSDRVQMTLKEVNDLIAVLFDKIKAIFDLHSTVLSVEHKNYLSDCLEGLNKSAGGSLIVDVNMFEINKSSDLSEDGEEEEKSSNQKKVARKYEEFLKALEADEEVQEKSRIQNLHFIAKMEKLPMVAENCADDVRYEAFIKKLVSHVRDRLVVGDNVKSLDTQCTCTTTWVIRAFRTMIENLWGMSIYARDDEGGEEEDIAAGPVMTALNNCGVTTLCLDLISVGIDSTLMLECVKLCVAMLFMEGGNLAVQVVMYEHLSGSPSDLFFQQMRISLKKLEAWHLWRDVIILEDGEDVDLPESIIIVRFLQLMCEGHYQANQDIMREQPFNTSSVNLLDDFVSYLNCLSRIQCQTNTDAAIRVSATILEVIQGPCEKNQEYFVLNTELVETLNRLMRSKKIRDCDEEAEIELKKTGIDILQGLLEGQGGNEVVYERVLSVIHLDIIQMLCNPPEAESSGKGDGDGENEDNDNTENEAQMLLQTESLVFLQMLCDYKPSLRVDLGLDKDMSIGSSVACVEIMWRGELQRRFFHVPDICADLAKSSKDNLVENIDRSNLESKLQDFVYRARDLYREVQHQQVLKRWKISGIFSRSNQNTATWIAFFIALTINTLLLVYYTATTTPEPTLPSDVRLAVRGLNIFQLVFATFTLILFLVVRVPVKYQSVLSKGSSRLSAVLQTATDGLTMYYFIYLIFCLLAINYSDTFVTFLLLDIIVKNSTTADVLNAVIYPRKQLAMTLVLGLFVMYIFAFIIVSLLVFRFILNLTI